MEYNTGEQQTIHPYMGSTESENPGRAAEECIICSMWSNMPYSKKPTTPVSAQEAEGLLIIGYWMASRLTVAPCICENHLNIVMRLDLQQEQLEEEEKRAAKAVEVPIHYKQQVVEFQRRRQLVTQPIEPIESSINLDVPFGISAPVTPTPVTPVNGNKAFSLGPGPLPNENNVTAHPSFLIPNNPLQPVRAQPGTIEGALEAARMPPMKGAKVTHNCPTCGESVTTGDVHAC